MLMRRTDITKEQSYPAHEAEHLYYINICLYSTRMISDTSLEE